MTEGEFAFLRKSLETACGIVLDDSKRYLVESRLLPVIQKLGISSISEFASKLQTSVVAGLLKELVEALVTTETSFFRDVHPWETLRKIILPALIARREKERTLRFWCAATASGQEPYSLAMLLAEHFPEVFSRWTISILATDISDEMLARARTGIFSQLEVNRGLPALMLVKYFKQVGTQWQVSESLRRAIEFRSLNLCKPWPFMPRFDVVMIRNVMIYFDVEMKKTILQRLAEVLRSDGILLLGATETTTNLDQRFERLPDQKSGFYSFSTNR